MFFFLNQKYTDTHNNTFTPTKKNTYTHHCAHIGQGISNPMNASKHGGCHSCCVQLYLELIWQNWLDQISSHVTHPSIWIEDEPGPCGMHGCPVHLYGGGVMGMGFMGEASCPRRTKHGCM